MITQDTFYVKVYAHRSSEEYFHWEMDDDGPKFSDELHEKIHYMAYETEFIYDITPSENTVTLRYVNAEGKWFPEIPPKEVLQGALFP